MGLMSKIEDKVKGNSSDQNKLEKERYESSSTIDGSHLQNPISSSGSGPTGSAVSGEGYGSQPGAYGSESGSYGNQPDTYTSKQGYTGSATSNRMPGSYEPRGEMTSTSSGHSPRQPFNPYSPKGQRTAADGEPTSQSQNFSRTSPHESSQQYASGSHGYESQPSSQHHYGRDAAMAGGAGVGGMGAYEMGKHQQNQPSVPHDTTHGHHHDESYGDRHSGGRSQEYGNVRPAEESSMGGGQGGMTGAMSGESAGLSHAKKMGGAYERGYQDAMDHMKAEMQKRA